MGRAILVLALVLESQAQQPTFRAGIDLVNFGVTVTDRRGNFLTDLKADDFVLIEDGQKQTLRLFARGDATVGLLGAGDRDEGALRQELHVGLLFDTSGSMSEDLKLSRSAAIKFLNTLPEADDMTLVDFDTEVRVAKYGQKDFPRLVERIRRRKPDGWTALYDALGVYLDGAHDDKGRKILVLYTDGGDTRSNVTFTDVMTFVRASDVTVYAIGLLEHQSSSVKNEQRMRLQQITEATGGQAFFPYSMKEVDAAYEKILGQIRAQYSLGYISSNQKTNGHWRKVDIRVKRPDVRIQARKGYFAPYKESQDHEAANREIGLWYDCVLVAARATASSYPCRQYTIASRWSATSSLPAIRSRRFPSWSKD